MLYYDHEISRQLGREHIDELAREYRRAQKGSAQADAAGEARKPWSALLARLRRDQPERVPAYRA